MNIQQLMQQAQRMQKQLQENQSKLKETEFTGSAGGENIIIKMSGDYNVKSIKISREVVDPDDIEMLEDLIVTAYNNCKDKIDTSIKDSLGGLPGNVGSALNSFM